MYDFGVLKDAIFEQFGVEVISCFQHNNELIVAMIQYWEHAVISFSFSLRGPEFLLRTMEL